MVSSHQRHDSVCHSSGGNPYHIAEPASSTPTVDQRMKKRKEVAATVGETVARRFLLGKKHRISSDDDVMFDSV